MKKLKKYIADYTKNMGYLFLPPTFVAYDKQKHGALSAWLTVVSFFFSQEFVTTVVASIISLVFVTAIGFGIELYQKYFTTDRQYDIKDVTIMIKVNLILIAILTLLQINAGTFTA